MPVALVYGWYVYNYPTCTFRYKLIAEVMTPDGLKTGSSVIEVRYSSVHPLPNPGRWRSDTANGEAVYVDLGGGKNLFVLLGADRWERKASRTPDKQRGFDGIKGSSFDKYDDDLDETRLAEGSLNALWLPVQVYKLGRKPGYEREMQRRVNDLLGRPPVAVELKNLPLIGTFQNLQIQESFSVLTPYEISKELGEGYTLKSITIQIVSDDVTAKLILLLPWLKGLQGGLREPPDRTKPDMLSSIGWMYFMSLGYRLEI
jgi:hypothetical protein